MKETATLPSNIAFPLCITSSHKKNKCSCGSNSLPILGIADVLEVGQAGGCGVVFHCFNLQFTNDAGCQAFFHVFFFFAIFFGELSIHIFSSFYLMYNQVVDFPPFKKLKRETSYGNLCLLWSLQSQGCLKTHYFIQTHLSVH